MIPLKAPHRGVVKHAAVVAQQQRVVDASACETRKITGLQAMQKPQAVRAADFDAGHERKIE
jgi:hypothetical protein